MKPQSLFARVLSMQVLMAIGLALLFGLLFYVERNITVARLLADQWAPALRDAAGLGAGGPKAAPLRRAEALPADALVAPGIAPRIAALRSALEADGVPVQSLALERGRTQATVWVAVAAGDGTTRWYGFDDRRLVEPDAARRLLIAVGTGLAVVALASWRFARRLARPLAELRSRMAALEPGRSDAAAADEPPLPAGGSIEVQAIDAAWRLMRERLVRHERERALLLAGVSHDLRSPLTRVRMAAALLPDDPAIAPRRDTIVRSVQAADRLIDDFLDHARFGSLALDQPVDLVPLARRLAAEQPTLQIAAPPTLVLQRAHPRLVERLIGNLVDNALKHGRAPVRLRLAAEGERVAIEVADAGPGIAPADRQALMQAFARGDASRGTPGSGLGLAIVREGVERLGGSIAFAQPAEGGFVVRLELPANQG